MQIRGYVLACAATFLIAAVSCRGKAVKGNETGSGRSVVELSQDILDKGYTDTLYLGKVRDGEVIVRDIILKNTDDKPFAITNVASGCGCVTFEFNRQPIASGDEKTVVMRFDSSGYFGEVVKKGSLLTSLSGRPYTIYVEATVE